MPDVAYVAEANSWLVRRAGGRPAGSGSRQLLLGQRLHVDPQSEAAGWIAAETVVNDKGEIHRGFIERARLSAEQMLKVFFYDVGQGDAALIEAEQVLILVDGGPNRMVADQLERRLRALRRADQAVGRPPRAQLHLNAVVVSHFDKDHYVGLTRLLRNPDYSFGTLYHNGLPRYGDGAERDLDLGRLSESPHGGRAITADLRDLDSARQMLDDGVLLTARGNLNQFGRFLQAASDAADEGRLDGLQFLARRDPAGPPVILPDTGPLQLEVLGPVTTRPNGPIRLQAFPDPHDISASNRHPAPSASHTINGNSVVLKLSFGDTSFLLGGDLNQPAQKYLGARFGDLGIFEADVNKACHHGSSDFDLDFVSAVRPLATVFSSGDSGNYDHPMPDAMGTAARYSRGTYPLIFSTELARETGAGRNPKILYGHINARSNGREVVMAQRRESLSSKKKWHSFPLPFHGPFGDH